MRPLNVLLVLVVAVVAVSARRRYRIRYADEDDYDERPIYIRRGRPRVYTDYGDTATSGSRDEPVYVIRRGKSRGHRTSYRHRPKTIVYEEPYAEESRHNRAPPPVMPPDGPHGPDAFKPMVVVQGTYAVHPKSKSLVPFEGSHRPIPREILSQI
ncbi:uncharacterized protein LOC135398820 [Ornithodoros turicata]|uniref:uncharacterized protein LOC135398820 n=1 Tax=Ornithodoros turicata TaxID=34597 RepID=UPI00313A2D7C